MSDVDYRDEHRKALEHIERLAARLAAAEEQRDNAVALLNEKAVRVTDMEYARLRTHVFGPCCDHHADGILGHLVNDAETRLARLAAAERDRDEARARVTTLNEVLLVLLNPEPTTGDLYACAWNDAIHAVIAALATPEGKAD